MTDRPTLENLDAVPESARWCCDGNAEDCPLCTDPNPDYPFICLGHPQTAGNDRIVEAATEATESTPWPQLEAHAFNAVQPALREVGERLPLSARRAVANAVLAAVQPRLAGHYQHAVDGVLEAERRAEQAEAALARVEELAARIEAGHPVQDNPDNLATAIREAARTNQPRSTR